jgi:GTP-binding protein HflX
MLRRGLEEMRGQRQRHREGRERSGLPVIALVGYTNAGKSSLMNALTDAGVLVQDKLFATLDPATRRLSLPGGRDSLLTDTVGFIRKLPHDLVAAFRATLEGIEEASLIVHVVDSSHPRATEQIAAVEAVLGGLEVSATPRLVAWNKIDLLPDPGISAVLGGLHEHSVAMSARTGKGLEDLLARMEALLGDALVDVSLLIPYGRYELVRLVYERGSVSGQADAPEGVRLRARVPEEVALRLADFKDSGG